MASKMVTDRQKSASLALAILDAQGARLRSGLRAELGEAGADAGLAYLSTLASRVAEARDGMIDADEAHEAELGDDPGAREARDVATATLRERLVTLRESVRGVYGPLAERALFSGSASPDPVVLARQAGEVAARLESNPLPPPRVTGATVDAAAIVQQLREGRDTLEAALEVVAREAREAQVTLTAKTGAMATYDRAFTHFASSLFTAFERADEPELAARVRPSRRRPGRLDAEVEGPPASPVAAL